MTRLPLFFLLCLCVCGLHAQDQANFWYFGVNAGIDFNGGSPTPISNSAMNTNEGCATISDCEGNLLFYTDGSFVWDSNHNQMPNGFGLLGDPSSSQSAVIVPQPGSTSVYFVFTVDNNLGPDGLRYSEVDLSLNGGLGDVTANKNILLHAPTTEKITAVLHGNNLDIWVIAHEWSSDAYVAYLVSGTGVNTTPVVSNVGAFIGGDPANVIGYIKASHDGTRVATAHKFLDTVELLDFDNMTGALSNPVSLTGFQGLGPYGVEFSPNNNFLYVTDNSTTLSNVYQYDITATGAAVAASRQTIGVFNGYLGTIQLAPNNVLYIAKLNSGFLGAVFNPNTAGMASNFVADAFFLLGPTSKLGLPTFIQSYFISSIITYEETCTGDTTQFLLETSAADSILWNFDDPGTPDNSSTLFEPEHIYTTPGEYEVSVVIWSDCEPDTIYETVEIFGPPQFTLGNDQFVCDALSVTLSTGLTGSFLWSDGSTNPDLTTSVSDLYIVEVEIDGCTASDTVDIFFADGLDLSLGADTTICDGSAFDIEVNTPGTLLWSDGSTDSIFRITQPGTYYVDGEFSGCEGTDTIHVNYFTHPGADLGGDIVVCDQETHRLSLPGNDSWLWSTGETDSVITVSNDGTYRVHSTLNGCSATDSVKVKFLVSPIPVGLTDTTFCVEEELLLDVRQINKRVNYVWSHGVEDPVTIIREPGLFTLDISNQCGAISETFVVSTTECRASLYYPNTITPNGDGINDVFTLKGHNIKEVHWQVFNRFGELLFSSQSLDQGWNAQAQGRTVPFGAYVVQVQATTQFNERIEEVQPLFVIR